MNREQSKRLDCLTELEVWGFSATSCCVCGKGNSEISGALIQCAKCKLAHYCGLKCFNADLQNHAKFCNTGGLEKQPKVRKDEEWVSTKTKKTPKPETDLRFVPGQGGYRPTRDEPILEEQEEEPVVPTPPEEPPAPEAPPPPPPPATPSPPPPPAVTKSPSPVFPPKSPGDVSNSTEPTVPLSKHDPETSADLSNSSGDDDSFAGCDTEEVPEPKPEPPPAVRKHSFRSFPPAPEPPATVEPPAERKPSFRSFPPVQEPPVKDEPLAVRKASFRSLPPAPKPPAEVEAPAVRKPSFRSLPPAPKPPADVEAPAVRKPSFQSFPPKVAPVDSDEDEIDIREEDAKAEAAEEKKENSDSNPQAQPPKEQDMLVLEIEEAEDDDEMHPQYLYVDEDEAGGFDMADTVVWLVRGDDDQFSFVRTDQSESVQIVQKEKEEPPPPPPPEEQQPHRSVRSMSERFQVSSPSMPPIASPGQRLSKSFTGGSPASRRPEVEKQAMGPPVSSISPSPELAKSFTAGSSHDSRPEMGKQSSSDHGYRPQHRAASTAQIGKLHVNENNDPQPVAPGGAWRGPKSYTAPPPGKVASRFQPAKSAGANRFASPRVQDKKDSQPAAACQRQRLEAQPSTENSTDSLPPPPPPAPAMLPGTIQPSRSDSNSHILSPRMKTDKRADRNGLLLSPVMAPKVHDESQSNNEIVSPRMTLVKEAEQPEASNVTEKFRPRTKLSNWFHPKPSNANQQVNCPRMKVKREEEAQPNNDPPNCPKMKLKDDSQSDAGDAGPVHRPKMKLSDRFQPQAANAGPVNRPQMKLSDKFQAGDSDHSASAPTMKLSFDSSDHGAGGSVNRPRGKISDRYQPKVNERFASAPRMQLSDDSQPVSSRARPGRGPSALVTDSIGEEDANFEPSRPRMSLTDHFQETEECDHTVNRPRMKLSDRFMSEPAIRMDDDVNCPRMSLTNDFRGDGSFDGSSHNLASNRMSRNDEVERETKDSVPVDARRNELIDKFSSHSSGSAGPITRPNMKLRDSWMQQCSLQSAPAVMPQRAKPRRRILRKDTSWVSTRTMNKNPNNDNVNTTTESKAKKALDTKTIKSAADLWALAGKENAEVTVQMYVRVVDPAEIKQQNMLSMAPPSVKKGTVLYKRVPVRPVAYRPTVVVETPPEPTQTEQERAPSPSQSAQAKTNHARRAMLQGSRGGGTGRLSSHLGARHDPNEQSLDLSNHSLPEAASSVPTVASRPTYRRYNSDRNLTQPMGVNRKRQEWMTRRESLRSTGKSVLAFPKVEPAKVNARERTTSLRSTGRNVLAFPEVTPATVNTSVPWDRMERTNSSRSLLSAS